MTEADYSSSDFDGVEGEQLPLQLTDSIGVWTPNEV